MTTSGALWSCPSLTSSRKTYSPPRSASRVGLTVLALINGLELPAGLETMLQMWLRRSPFGSLLWEPSSRMMAFLQTTFWSAPALAVGALVIVHW